jgi:hypothetical protein
MSKNRLALLMALIGLTGPGARTSAAPVDLNTPRSFPAISSRSQWEVRAGEIREQVLVSCGLWPLPAKTPLAAHIFGKIERDGYSVEKVFFQSWPGFYVGGNLYRPLGRGRGPFPGVLNPHGHWKEGRLADTAEGSVPARCISFARQGMVAFAYDMVGFNDTRFADSPTNRPFYEVHRMFGTNRTDLLWNISLMGLQTWNSIRALDFLVSLPEVDRRRLACTGASGGGTQTFTLGAIDDRLAAQAPVVMVSHVMQGGCSCENAPGLRVEYSNMEIAAAAAPRPQLLVAATGDWTRSTLTLEGPAIAGIYQLFQAPDKFRYVRFEYGHNYNQASREAVYDWFGRWLLHQPDPASLQEAQCRKEPDADLRVFPPGQWPRDALTLAQLTDRLKQSHQARWQALVPRKRSELKRFQEAMLPAWRHTLQVPWPNARARVQTEPLRDHGKFQAAKVDIRMLGDESPASIQTSYWAPPGILSNRQPRLVVVCSPDDNAPPILFDLLRQGFAALVVERFPTAETADPFANFFCTYNRTLVQQRVRDLTTLCAVAGSVDPRRASTPFRVTLCGLGRAGLWTLLAAPAADAAIADCNQLDATSDEALLAPEVFCPGLRNLGGFEGAAVLAAPQPLLLHNTGSRFPTSAISAAQKAAGNKRCRLEPARLSDAEIVKWLTALE